MHINSNYDNDNCNNSIIKRRNTGAKLGQRGRILEKGTCTD